MCLRSLGGGGRGAARRGLARARQRRHPLRPRGGPGELLSFSNSELERILF